MSYPECEGKERRKSSFAHVRRHYKNAKNANT